MHLHSLLASLALLAGCPNSAAPNDSADSGSLPEDSGDSGIVGDEVECAEAAARLGYSACVHTVPDDTVFNSVTISSSSVDQLRVGKYLVPANENAVLPGLFLDVNSFQLHYDFLTQAFPDDFSGLTNEQYQSLILYPDTRVYYGGTYSLYLSTEGYFYGFTVWDDPAEESATVTEADVTAVYTELMRRWGLDDLRWVPNSSNQEAAALGWGDTPFLIENPADIDYEAYNIGEAYGYLRLFTLDEFADATDAATFSYQDILVIEEAPEDIERVVSGIVTGTRQGALSHLSVRSAARGTPNCYIKNPGEALAAFEDQMVHFECGSDAYSVETATVEQATEWWESIRPDPVEICAPNLLEMAMPNLLDLDTSTQEIRLGNICTYGAKGSNLATLYTIVPPEYQLDGFVIPFYYYQQFMTENTWRVDLGSGESSYTFQETVDAWHLDPEFLSDASLRRTRLESMQAAMMESDVSPEVVELVSDQIWNIWGTDTIGVRFRSSSNAEDGLEFSGAGLYLSRTACLADENDGESDGPSACDEDTDEERTVSNGLKTVWSSMWNIGAWEERDWYGIDPSLIAMGILADTRSMDEQANIVAFTGNPGVVDDNRYLVNAQYGEMEVVFAESGVYPEKTLLTLTDGQLTLIERVSASSEAEIVLSDAQLEELSELFYQVAEQYPVDYAVPEGGQLLWDTEWKVWSDGQLIVKQIRPFLR